MEPTLFPGRPVSVMALTISRAPKPSALPTLKEIQSKPRTGLRRKGESWLLSARPKIPHDGPVEAEPHPQENDLPRLVISRKRFTGLFVSRKRISGLIVPGSGPTLSFLASERLPG